MQKLCEKNKLQLYNMYQKILGREVNMFGGIKHKKTHKKTYKRTFKKRHKKQVKKTTLLKVLNPGNISKFLIQGTPFIIKC